ncbi:MAG: DNA polymerase III subunit delta' [Gemmataceae bacterium]
MGWQRVRGHDLLIEGFRRVVQRGRLAHAYLFCGPVGVGKALFARELARALLCEQPLGKLEACDHCPACKQLEAGSHPDFTMAVRPPDLAEFPIALMRALCENFSLKSARGRGKVVLIDDADDLNAESANCFLKTLEEPPAGSMLILIGSSPERQLPTIVSRCQVVRFAPLPQSLVEEILAQEGVDDPTQRRRLANLGHGSPALSLQLADPDLWKMRGQLITGLTGRPIDPVELGKAWMAFVEEAGKKTSAQRRRASLVLRLVIDFFQDVLTVGTGAPPRRTDPADLPQVQSLASRLDPSQVLSLLDRCLEADAQIDRRVQLILVLEALLDHLAQQTATPIPA